MSEKDLPVKTRKKIVIRDEDFALLFAANVIPKFLDGVEQRQPITEVERNLVKRAVEKTQLDPFPPARQIYFLTRRITALNRFVLISCASIDGFRLIAQRTGEYEGQRGPFYMGKINEYQELSFWPYTPEQLEFVCCYVFRKGFREPLRATIDAKAFRGKGPMWGAQFMLMIGLPPERQALRKAFPQELSGLYGEEELAVVDAYTQRQEELHEPQGPGFVKKEEPEPAPAREVPAPADITPGKPTSYFWPNIPKELKEAVDKFKGESLPVKNPRGVFFERLRKLDPPMTPEEAKYLVAQFYGIREVDVSFGDKDLDLEIAKEKFEALWAVIMYQVDKEAKAEQEPVVTNQAEFNRFVAWMHELISPSHNLYGDVDKTLFPSGKKLPKYIERVKAVLVLLTMNGIDIPEDNPMHKWLQKRGL